MFRQKAFLIFILILLVAGAASVYYFLFFRGRPGKQEENYMPKNLTNKKIAMVIAFKDFRDEEYFVPKQVFENNGAEVKTVSSERGIAIGADGGEVEVDFLLADVNPAEFDAIVFIGGPGALKYLDNEDSYRLAQETISANKVLGAICVSPVVLAKAGVLNNKKATVWTSPLDKSAAKTLKENGANYQAEMVVRDGLIVTGNGPAAAEEFAEKVSDLLIK